MTCRASWSLFLEVSNCTSLSLFCTPFLPLGNWRWKTRWAPHLDLQLSAIYKWYPNPSGCIAHLFSKLLFLRQEIKSPLSFSTRLVWSIGDGVIWVIWPLKVNVLGSFAWDAGTFGLGIDIPGWDRDFQRWRGEWLYVVHLFQLSMNFMEHFLHHDLIVVWTRNPSQTFEVLQGGGMLLIREVGHWVHFSTDIIANRADHQFRSQGCWGCSD